ncbi:MAG: hypothetical protein ACK5UC_20660 [Planctomycetaceae bacterium]|jgi:hypothetical protein
MSRLPRKFLFDPHEVARYLGINRCVHRSMLCGWAPLTQRSYGHHEVWLQHRAVFLAAVMAIDVQGFSLMDNHLHAMLRN